LFSGFFLIVIAGLGGRVTVPYYAAEPILEWKMSRILEKYKSLFYSNVFPRRLICGRFFRKINFCRYIEIDNY